MANNYQAPGVYIEDLPSSGARPIESVATAVLAIVGLYDSTRPITKVGKTESQADQRPNQPILVTNWTQFTQTYGGLDQQPPIGYLHQAMYGYFLNGGRQAYIVGLPVPPPPTAILKNQKDEDALRITWTHPLEQGTEVKIEVKQPEKDTSFSLTINITRSGSTETLPTLKTKMETVKQDLDTATNGRMGAELLSKPGPLKDDTYILESQITTEKFIQGITALEAYEEITLLVCPDLFAVFAPESESVVAVQKAMVEHCQKMEDRMAILDMPKALNVSGAKTWLEKLQVNDKYAAVYYPWLKVTRAGSANPSVVPPSGYMAGVYARVDSERGVHKAPANEVIRGATGLTYNVTRNDQETLNPDGVNCIRTFPGQGIRIWGARTLSSDTQWQYINVQRLFANIEDSIIQNTRWVVFEPNDPILWAAIRRDISAYLMRIWRQGALFGSTPEEAFYVKCDAETNPPEVIQAGYCVIEVGIAPVRPAEFVVIRIGQWDGGASASE